MESSPTEFCLIPRDYRQSNVSIVGKATLHTWTTLRSVGGLTLRRFRTDSLRLANWTSAKRLASDRLQPACCTATVLLLNTSNTHSFVFNIDLNEKRNSITYALHACNTLFVKLNCKPWRTIMTSLYRCNNHFISVGPTLSKQTWGRQNGDTLLAWSCFPNFDSFCHKEIYGIPYCTSVINLPVSAYLSPNAALVFSQLPIPFRNLEAILFGNV